MIPSAAVFVIPEETVQPSYDFRLNSDKNNVAGTVELLEEIKQAIYFILNTEQYQYEIYSWEYGMEYTDLIGMPPSYVVPELEKRITEALIRDDRIKSVTDFNFERNKNVIHATFKVSTIYGDLESEAMTNV